MLNAAVTNRRLPRKRFFIKIAVQLAGPGAWQAFCFGKIYIIPAFQIDTAFVICYNNIS